MEKRIQEICSDLCCREISIDEQLIVTGILDSFKIMELICILEEEFHIIFQPEEIMELDNFSCVDHITAIIRRKNKNCV